MTNNCLITKLKGVVDNDNLNRLGEIKINLTEYVGEQQSASNFSFVIDAGSNTYIIEALGNGYILDDTIPNPEPTKYIERSGRFWCAVPNQPDFTLSIRSKYELTELSFLVSGGSPAEERSKNTDISVFEYMPNCHYLNLNIDFKGDITKVFTLNPNLVSFIARSYTIGTLDLQADFDKMPIALCVNTLVTFSATWSAGVTGNITYFAPFINLTTLDLTATAVTGTLEALANAMAVNRKSGSLTVNASYTALTYQGERFDTLIITFTENGYTISTPS